MKNKAFNNWKHNAIHLTFPNGNSLSTTWGYGTYSDNYDNWSDNVFRKFMSSDTVEVMILKAPEKLVKKIYKKYDENRNGNIIGFLTMEQWLEVVKMLSK
jgi:hypothetical protein